MRPNFLADSKSRRNATAARHPSRSTRPSFDHLEGRRLLSGTPYLLINSVHATESQAGSTMNFTVNLTSASTVPVTVHYQTADRTAIAGTDYAATSGTLTFAPGQTALSIPVSILPQTASRPTDTFSMVLSSPTNATVLTGTGNGTIIAPPPVAQSMTIADVSMARGLGGTTTMIFTVKLATASATPVSVTAATSDLTAKAGVDYQAESQVLTFAPGVTSMQFAVTIYGTSTPTASEIFLVTLSGTTVPIGRATAAGVLNYGA